MRVLVTCLGLLALGLGCTPLLAASDEETLEILAGQAFMQLHETHVTLPDQTTERVARSNMRLPFGWQGGLKGLIREEYIVESFLDKGLSAIESGTWLFFYIPDIEVYVAVNVAVDGNGEILIKAAYAADEISAVSTSPLDGNGCGTGEETPADDDFECSCGGNDCSGGCTGPGSEAWTATGNTTEGGNAIMENTTGQTAEVCGESSIGVTLSPL